MGHGNWAGASGLAPGVLGDGYEVPGSELRSACRRRRPDVPAPRKRNRAIGGAHRPDLLTLLDACALSAGRREEDVEVTGQLLHAARVGADGPQAFFDPISAGQRAVQAAA